MKKVKSKALIDRSCSCYLTPLRPAEIVSAIKQIKPKYEKEGLIILALFGSYAKGKATKESDIDLLYDIDPEKFCKKHPGFKAFYRINEIKKELKDFFGKEVDLATIDNHNKVFKNNILKEAIYVN